MYKILSPYSANVNYEILICMALWLYFELGKVWTTVQFDVETPKIFQHFTDRWVRIQPRMICEDQATEVMYHFGSANGRLLQETRLAHAANWESNLGGLIVRLPSLLDLGSLSTAYVVNAWLQFSETVQLRHSDLTNNA